MRLDHIELGDARVLSKGIPNDSVDLVFTDPVYENVDDYVWLAEESFRTLNDAGILLVWCSSNKQYEIQPKMSKILTFCLPIFYTVKAKSFMLRFYKVFCWTTPALIFRKNQWSIHNSFPDTYISEVGPSGRHKWNKNLGVIEYYIRKLKPPGSIVWDPFCGSGSVPLACKHLGYHFYASEIDPETHGVALNRTESGTRYLF